MNLAHWLQRRANIDPHRPAIAHGETVWADYAGFAARAARTAGWLRSQRVSAGDRVALFLPNRPEYLPLLWGIWWAGAVAVPVNAKLHVRETAWIAGHSGSRIVFTDADHRDALVGALREAGSNAQVVGEFGFLDDRSIPLEPITDRAENDPAWLFYTSGTTGRPKGVTLAARQLRWCSMAYLASVQPVGPADVMLHPAPLSHGGGLYHLPYVLNGGLNVVPASGGFEPAEVLALAAHWRNASFFAAPTIVRRLVDAARHACRQPEGLATICYGGGPMYLADIEDALDVIGPHFAQIYGQGECPMTISVLPRALINDRSQPRWRERLASVGYAQSMVEVTVRGDDGEALPAGSSGEVCVRGDVVMEGYWNDPAATAATLRDGWLWTGDIGRLDDDGFLTLLDRSKDLVVSGGSNIYPREVEEALLMHPGVAEVSVIGRPDPEWGEVIVAYVVRSGAVDAAALDAFCVEHIARFKRPKHYRFVDELPKNNYGKVLKTALREIEAGKAAGGDAAPSD
ncbi:AMP-binding protein [Piscinibacter sakaiensis]|uniref:AMP-binding protein n=1 Tax=Piscinibacter sakaiensis TaxID=1547922 RepID=UPI003AAA95FA